MSDLRELASQIVRVTFFEDRAAVARRSQARLDPGVHTLVIEGLSLTADDASLVAGIAQPGARVLGAKIVRRVRGEPRASTQEIAAIEEDLRRASRRGGQAEQARGRAASEVARVSSLLESWNAGVRRVPRGGPTEAARWRAAHDALDAALTKATDELAAAERELSDAGRDVQRAQLRLAQGRTLEPRYAAAAEVQVEIAPGEAREITLELGYRTPGALWRPEHLARLDGTKLSIRTSATVWQRTGENWQDVPCRFSTARPAQVASPPLLASDYVSMTRRQDKNITVEAREQTINLAGLDRGSRQADEMPGVEDGGEPLWFDAARPVTIPSDGQPFRVEIGEITMPCEVDLVVYPELGPSAFLRATATLVGGKPLLAGPVRVARGGSIVGKNKTSFVGQGEPFELGFGVDDGVRVRRTTSDQRETTPVIGTQKLTRTVRLFLSNVGGAARRLKVIERIPVSEIEDVSIDLVQAGGAKLDEKDGFATYAVELGANQTQSLSLIYKVEAAAKIRLNL